MTDNFVNDVLDGGFFAVAELIAGGADLVDLVFQKLHKVAVFVSGHKGYRPNEAMPTLPSFCERIGQVWEPFIELLGGLVNRIRARIEMDAVGDITGQEEHSDEICGFHGSSLPLGLRSFNFFGKGLAL
jgi:hypothetical protein